MKKRIYCILLATVVLTLACGVVLPTMPTETAAPVNTAVHVTISPTARPVYVVAGDWNLRDGATEASTKRGELRDGQTVMILLCRPDGWCRLDNGYYLCGRAVGLAEKCK